MYCSEVHIGSKLRVTYYSKDRLHILLKNNILRWDFFLRVNLDFQSGIFFSNVFPNNQITMNYERISHLRNIAKYDALNDDH